jgi:Beta-propeller repeat
MKIGSLLRVLRVGSAFGVLGFLAVSCSSAQESEEGTGAVEDALSKCDGGKLGASNYCSSTCKCDNTEGDCDGDSNCNAPFVCSGHLAYFYPGLSGNACAAAHCRNKIQDVGETQIDCGGECGDNCPDACADNPPNPQAGHCTTDCPCPAKQGDCQNAANKCAMGLVCSVDSGALFGYAASVDVCVGANCSNAMQDGMETGVDCGGPACAPCGATGVSSAGYGGPENDHGLAMVVDGGGNTFVAGRFAGTSNFGGMNLSSNAGSADVFVAKYNNAGNHVWSTSFGSPGPDGDFGVGIALDSTGNIYLAGNFWSPNTITFGATTLSSAGLSDIFLVQLNSTGAPTWAKSFGGTASDRANGLVVTGSSAYVVGGFQGSVNFGGSTHGSAGGFDIFALKVTTAAGAFQYSSAFGGTGADQAISVAVDTAGSAYLVGNFTGTVSFGATSLVGLGSTDVFTAKLGTGGAVTWAKSFGGTSNDSGAAIAIDASRNPTVVGLAKRTVDFGDGLPVLVAGTDAFAVSYTTGGAYRWHKVIGGTGVDRGQAVTTDTSGNVIVVGDFEDTMDLGGGMLSAGAGRSMFIARYAAATGAFQAGAGYGAPGSVTPLAVVRYTNTLTVTGDFTGTANFGGADITSNGLVDMFFAKFAN